MANDVEMIIKDGYEAWNSHDLDRVVSGYTDDCVYESLPMGVACHGKNESKALAKQFLLIIPTSILSRNPGSLRVITQPVNGS